MSLEQLPKQIETSVKRVEQVSKSVEEAKVLSASERLRFVLNDPKCKEAYEALLRSIINGFISIADVLPFVGDAAEATILALKVSPTIKSLLLNYAKNPKKLEKHFDLTPDISVGTSLAISAASVPLEAVTGSTSPSYLINTLWQLKADIDNKRFDGAVDSMKVLMTGKLDKITPETQERLNKAREEFK